jgi:hypothetical protein
VRKPINASRSLNRLISTSAALVLLCCSQLLNAKDWQIMIVPDAQMDAGVEAVSPHKLSVIRAGINRQLMQQLDVIIASERIFSNCMQALCGMGSVQALLKQVAEKAPEVELVLFYQLQQSRAKVSLQATLIDPLSFQTYDTFRLNVLTEDRLPLTDNQLNSASVDIGRVISLGLQQLVKRAEFDLSLQGFALDEVAPFSSYVLSNARSTKLTLTKSEQQRGVMSAYFPIMQTQLKVASDLTQSQFNHLLLGYFQAQGISVVSEYQRGPNQFVVSRLGNPHMPSIITFVLIIMIGALCSVLLIKRQRLDYQLGRLAEMKSVDQWLRIYAKAKSPRFLLQTKWRNQLSYWQRLQRESNELEIQARLFFEAGDVNTAKLFISKALNLNNDAAIAKALNAKIAEQESSHHELSQKEQWVRNKVAKTMNSYRDKQPLIALRYAYQALNETASEKHFKRQHKAINRLVDKVNMDFAQTHQHIELTDLVSGKSYLISAFSELEIGRFNHASADQAVQSSSIEFCVNHKALSRVGKHCKISARDHGFYIQDNGSTNGTYLQNQRLETSVLQQLVNGDIVRLGSNSELTAVKLKVRVDAGSTLMQLRVDKQLTHTLDVADLARVWPDYIRAMRASVVLTRADCIVAVDKQTNTLCLVSLADMQQSTQYLGLVRIALGVNASLRPVLDSSAQPPPSLLCNDEHLLGEVPLVLPCEIKFEQQHLMINAYLPYGMRHSSPQAEGFHLRVGSDASR